MLGNHKSLLPKQHDQSDGFHDFLLQNWVYLFAGFFIVQLVLGWVLCQTCQSNNAPNDDEETAMATYDQQQTTDTRTEHKHVKVKRSARESPRRASKRSKHKKWPILARVMTINRQSSHRSSAISATINSKHWEGERLPALSTRLSPRGNALPRYAIWDCRSAMVQYDSWGCVHKQTSWETTENLAEASMFTSLALDSYCE